MGFTVNTLAIIAIGHVGPAIHKNPVRLIKLLKRNFALDDSFIRHIDHSSPFPATPQLTV